MKINKILADKTPTISFEVFPPKAETGLNDVKTAAGAIAALNPSYMSVTYGAAGSTSKMTIEVASDIKNLHGVTVCHTSHALLQQKSMSPTCLSRYARITSTTSWP